MSITQNGDQVRHFQLRVQQYIYKNNIVQILCRAQTLKFVQILWINAHVFVLS